MSMSGKHYDQAYFENFSYREKLNSQRNRNRLQEILAYKKGGKLLEIGCGKGEFLKLTKQYFTVEAIDISEYVIDSIKPSFGNRVKKGNIEKINLTTEAYDVTAVFNILEHLKHPIITIKKIYHSLVQDGIMIGSVPNNSGLIGRSNTAISNFFDRTHCSTYPPSQWRVLFGQAGFRKINFYGETLLGRNRNYYIRHKLWHHLSFNLMFLCEK